MLFPYPLFPVDFQQRLARPIVRTLLLLTTGIGLSAVVVCSPAQAQSPVDLATAQQYTNRLESNFWETAWVRSLEEDTDRNGSVDWNYDDRQELSALITDYQRAIGNADGFWTNPQVQDYLQRRLLTVQPNPMMPGRPGAFRLRILSTTTPNALALNDGTLILTTGLLTILTSEAQLDALLAHEVAHVVLDHALATYQSGKKNNRARNLLGSVIGGVTSVVTPGLGGRRPLESSVYDLSSGLATEYLDREFIAAAGLKYNRQQERAANRLAQEWLLARNHPPDALYSALRTLQSAGTQSHSTHGSSFSDSHPGTDVERREQLAAVLEENGADPSVLDRSDLPPDREYDTHIAAVLEHQAELDLADRRFHSARTVLDRALRTDWATGQTSLFKAIAVRNTTTGADGVDEALSLLDEAEAAIDEVDPRIEAERALLRVRENRPEQAREHLARCLDQIAEARATENASEATHANLHEWATDMQSRLGD